LVEALGWRCIIFLLKRGERMPSPSCC